MIVGLRVSIGVHFYNEGAVKREQRDWSAAGFFKSAKGPMAPYFHDVVEDLDGKLLLCVEKDETEGSNSVSIDPHLTLLLWKDFADRAAEHYQFSSPEFIKDLEFRVQLSRKLIKDSNDERTKPVDEDKLRSQIAEFEATIKKVPDQLIQLDEALQRHTEELKVWLEANRTELIAHYSTADRVDGFARDGDAAREVAMDVESLRSQVDSIRTDRNRKLAGWTKEVQAIWDSYEKAVNDVRMDKQLEQSSIALHRPYDQPYSRMKWIDSVIPWFDMAIGASLILGFLVRMSSLLGALFLLSVVISQPPWIPGTIPTFFQLIEMFALLVLCAIGAGRFLGVDVLFAKRETKEEVASLS